MTSMGEPREAYDPHASHTLPGPHGSAPLSDTLDTSDTPAAAHEPVAPVPSLSRAPHNSARMPSLMTTSTRSPRQRLTWLVTASISVLGISALLASCLYWTVLPPLQAFVGSQFSAVPGQATSGPPSAGSATLVATSAAQAPSDWYSEPYSGTNVRFRIEMPAMLACAHGFFINDFSGFGCDYSYSGAHAQTDLQRVELETQVELLSSTKVTDRNICPQGGTQVRVGTGTNTLIGWERDDVSKTTSDGTVTLNLVVHGTPVQLSLMGFGGEPQPFFERYGAIWRHMLASFTLLSAAVTQPVHPCG